MGWECGDKQRRYAWLSFSGFGLPSDELPGQWFAGLITLRMALRFPISLGLPLRLQTSGNYIVGASDELLDRKLSVSANILGRLTNNSSVTALSARYTYSDRLEFRAFAMWLEAEAGTPFEAMDGFTQYGLTSMFRF